MSDPGAKENRKPGAPPPLSQPAARQNRAQSAPARAERASLSIEEEQQEKSKEAAELDHLVKGLKDLVLRRTLRRNSALAPGLASSSSQDCICVIYDLVSWKYRERPFVSRPLLIFIKLGDNGSGKNGGGCLFLCAIFSDGA